MAQINQIRAGLSGPAAWTVRPCRCTVGGGTSPQMRTPPAGMRSRFPGKVECEDRQAFARIEAVSVGAVRRGVEVEQLAACRAGALLKFGEQSAADALGPGGSSDHQIIDGQLAASEGGGNDPPSGDAEAGTSYVGAGEPQALGMPLCVDDLQGLGCQMRPQFTEHGQDIGGKPRVIGADVGELQVRLRGRARGASHFHCVTSLRRSGALDRGVHGG